MKYGVGQKLTLNKQSPHQDELIWQLDQTFSSDTSHDFSAILEFPVIIMDLKKSKEIFHAINWYEQILKVTR